MSVSLGEKGSAFLTISWSNYWGRAEILFESINRHHPESNLFLLALDRAPEAARRFDGVARVLSLRDIGLSKAEIFRRKVIYSPTEFATSVKPKALIAIAGEFSRVTYLDPDIQVFKELIVADRDGGKELLLTPHTLTPLPEDGLALSVKDLHDAGIFNLGFISIASAPTSVLKWWDSRLQVDGDFRPGETFTDQKTAELLVSLAEVGILRDPGWNVAHWNLHERHALPFDEISFFHFSGFDPKVPQQLTSHRSEDGRHRGYSPSWLPELLQTYADLCEEKASMSIQDSEEYVVFPSFPTLRQIVRESLKNHSGYEKPPADPRGLGDWLWRPGTGVAGSPLIPPIAMAYFLSRLDSQHAFHGVRDGQPGPSSGYLEWARKDQGSKAFVQAVSRSLRLPRRASPKAQSVYPALHGVRKTLHKSGLNHLAYFHGQVGIADASRLLSAAIEESGIPFKNYDLPNVLDRQVGLSYTPTHAGEPLEFAHSILGVNADQVRDLFIPSGFYTTTGKRIGYWWWEVKDLTSAHYSAARKLNEVWVGSRFVYEALAKELPCPVKIVPLPLKNLSGRYSRLEEPVKESGPTTFFHASSLASDPRRKNPLGTALAYIESFSEGDGARLRLHLTGGGSSKSATEGLAEVLAATRHRKDIEVSLQRISPERLAKEISQASCFVSLHRSEGLGLNIRDAVELGTPVIATAYGGSLDFLSASLSQLIPFTEVTVGKSPFYSSNAIWAEPSMDDAVRSMRSVAGHPEEFRLKAKRARGYIRELLSGEIIGAALEKALFEIG